MSSPAKSWTAVPTFIIREFVPSSTCKLVVLTYTRKSMGSYRRTWLRNVSWLQQHDVASIGPRTFRCPWSSASALSTCFGDRCFRCAAERIWTQLPPSQRDLGVTYGQFCRQLKSHLFVLVETWNCEALWLIRFIHSQQFMERTLSNQRRWRQSQGGQLSAK